MESIKVRCKKCSCFFSPEKEYYILCSICYNHKQQKNINIKNIQDNYYISLLQDTELDDNEDYIFDDRSTSDFSLRDENNNTIFVHKEIFINNPFFQNYIDDFINENDDDLFMFVSPIEAAIILAESFYGKKITYKGINKYISKIIQSKKKYYSTAFVELIGLAKLWELPLKNIRQLYIYLCIHINEILKDTSIYDANFIYQIFKDIPEIVIKNKDAVGLKSGKCLPFNIIETKLALHIIALVTRPYDLDILAWKWWQSYAYDISNIYHQLAQSNKLEYMSMDGGGKHLLGAIIKNQNICEQNFTRTEMELLNEAYNYQYKIYLKPKNYNVYIVNKKYILVIHSIKPFVATTYIYIAQGLIKNYMNRLYLEVEGPVNFEMTEKIYFKGKIISDYFTTKNGLVICPTDGIINICFNNDFKTYWNNTNRLNFYTNNLFRITKYGHE